MNVITPGAPQPDIRAQEAHVSSLTNCHPANSRYCFGTSLGCIQAASGEWPLPALSGPVATLP
jgi:hypothetical protein